MKNRTSSVLKKYKNLYKKLQFAMQSGQFAYYSVQKKQSLLNRFQRYERQLLRGGILVAGLSSLLLSPTNIDAQTAAIAGEFQVNTFTDLYQYVPDVAMDADGDFVVVWESSPQDGSSYGIYGQRYNSDGSKAGTEFLVNTHTTNSQSFGQVSMDDSGNFVVVWRSNDQDGDSGGIYGQRYNSDGSTAGSEFQINTFTTNIQLAPDVAMDSDGDFVVVWQSFIDLNNRYDIRAQRFDKNGNATGSEFQVNTTTITDQRSPTIAMDDDGNFVVTWYDAQNGDEDIFGRRFASNGSPIGGEFLINTFTTADQFSPRIAMDNDGDFVVIWQSVGQDGDSGGIYGQRFNNAGNVVGSEFLVNTYTTADQFDPAVAMDKDGNFVVLWGSTGQDGDGDGVYGQRFKNDGSKIDGEFQAHTYTTYSQREVSVAMDDDGDFIAAWTSGEEEVVGPDGSYYGVFAQRYLVSFGNCESDSLSLFGTENGMNDYLSQDQISSIQSIESSAVVNYESATFISLQAGFQALNGADFIAKIEDCAAILGAETPSDITVETLLEERSFTEKVDENVLHIFPNPFNSETTIKFHLAEASDIELLITDMNGRTVHQQQYLDTQSGWQAHQLDLSHLLNGMYSLHIQSAEQRVVKQLIVQK